MTSPKIKELSAEKRLLLAARKEAERAIPLDSMRSAVLGRGVVYSMQTDVVAALLRFAQNEARKAASRERKRAIKEAAEKSSAYCLPPYHPAWGPGVVKMAFALALAGRIHKDILSLGSQKPR